MTNQRGKSLMEILKDLQAKVGAPSPEELEFNRYCKLYWEKFGENYGFAFGYQPEGGLKDGIEDIQECLASGKRSEKPWMNPVYEEGKIY